MLTDVGTSVVYWKASVGEQEVSGTATLSVTPAVVTVRVLDQRVRVGAEVPSLENPTENTDYTVTGLLGDDALTGLVLHYATTPIQIRLVRPMPFRRVAPAPAATIPSNM